MCLIFPLQWRAAVPFTRGASPATCSKCWVFVPVSSSYFPSADSIREWRSFFFFPSPCPIVWNTGDAKCRKRKAASRQVVSSENSLCRAHLLFTGFHQMRCVIASGGCVRERKNSKCACLNVVHCGAEESINSEPVKHKHNYLSGMIFFLLYFCHECYNISAFTWSQMFFTIAIRENRTIWHTTNSVANLFMTDNVQFTVYSFPGPNNNRSQVETVIPDHLLQS